MNTSLMAVTLATILIASAGTMPALAQTSDPITITTDKESYAEGETIMVTGEISQLLSGQVVTVRVLAPNGNIVAIAQVSVSDGMFSTELIAGGLMKAEGTYTIKALYGSQNRSAETTFMFGGSTGQTDMPSPNMGKSSIMLEGVDDPVTFSITGGEIIKMMPDTDAMSLIITINAMDDGSLTVTIPRAVMDSVTSGGEDDDFFVLVDGEEYEFDETSTETDRTLTIEFLSGAEEIEIIGSWVIPEFGTIAVMILAVAIISIIAVSARSRLSIMSRY